MNPLIAVLTPAPNPQQPYDRAARIRLFREQAEACMREADGHAEAGDHAAADRAWQDGAQATARAEALAALAPAATAAHPQLAAC